MTYVEVPCRLKFCADVNYFFSVGAVAEAHKHWAKEGVGLWGISGERPPVNRCGGCSWTPRAWVGLASAHSLHPVCSCEDLVGQIGPHP